MEDGGARPQFMEVWTWWTWKWTWTWDVDCGVWSALQWPAMRGVEVEVGYLVGVRCVCVENIWGSGGFIAAS